MFQENVFMMFLKASAFSTFVKQLLVIIKQLYEQFLSKSFKTLFVQLLKNQPKQLCYFSIITRSASILRYLAKSLFQRYLNNSFPFPARHNTYGPHISGAQTFPIFSRNLTEKYNVINTSQTYDYLTCTFKIALYKCTLTLQTI